MGEILDSHIKPNDPFSGFYLYEPGPEGLKRNRDSYPRMWGLLLAQLVEVADGSQRRSGISRLYKLAHEYGFPASEMNDYYDQALTTMKRERTVADEIEYTETALTSERVQIWPPDMDAVDKLQKVIVSRPVGSRVVQLTYFH